MKKILLLTISLLLIVSLLAGCGEKKDGATNQGSNSSSDSTTIKIGALPTPHAEILDIVKEILAQEGYTLEIVEFIDYILPNTSLEEGSLDANFFQHNPYLKNFNEENHTHLVSVCDVHYEPFAIYPGNKKSLEELSDGDKIAVPNDLTNEARALQLLADKKLISITEDVGLYATTQDIIENPKNLVIVELEAAQIASALPDVALGLLNGNYALLAGLNASEDSLGKENADTAKEFSNVIAVKEGNEKNPKIKALIDAVQSDLIKSFIEEKYKGAVVTVF